MISQRNLRKLNITMLIVVAFLLSLSSYAQPATALNFDGVDDFVDCGSNASVSNLGPTGFTLEAWINLSDVSGVKSIIRKSGDYNFYIEDGTLHAEVWPLGTGDDSWKRIDGSASIDADTWTHIAVVWDGTVGTLYVNGNIDNSTFTEANIPVSENLYLGLSAIFGQPVSGSMDEVRIWNRALCQVEIQNNKNCELDPVGQTGLVALYHLNQGEVNADNTSITTATDASGNENNGTLNNFDLTDATSNWVAGTASGTCSAFVPPILAGSAGGAAVCQVSTVQPTGTFYLDGTCNLIVSISPSGASPVSGSINSCVQIDGSVQFYNSQPYVQRHYDITPSTNPATSTATVTMYFTQEEFNAFNTERATFPALPVSAVDEAGIGNLLITQFHGTGTAPGNYSGGGVLINPADSNIIWNNSLSRWEITFDINGFSGFYVHTSNNNTILPIDLLSFSGRNNGNVNLLEWTTSAEQNSSYFDLLRSTDGINFVKAGTITAAGNSNISRQYHYSDNIAAIKNNLYFYKLKITDQSGSSRYSSIVKISLNSKGFNVASSPNPFVNQLRINVETLLQENAAVSLTNVSGRMIQQKILQLQNGNNTILLSNLDLIPAGVYMLTVKTGSQLKTVKVVKQ
jgi:hypothetical protein